MNAFISYLLQNLMLDFEGDLTLGMARDFLKGDENRDARVLLTRLYQDGSTADLMITLADCLKDHLRTGISEDVVREKMRMYIES